MYSLRMALVVPLLFRLSYKVFASKLAVNPLDLVRIL